MARIIHRNITSAPTDRDGDMPLHKIHTPWGTPHTAKQYGDGIIFFVTAGHGGFRVERETYLKACAKRNIPPIPKSQHTESRRHAQKYIFFEEDTEWSFVALTFPDLFKQEDVNLAHSVLKSWYPRQWEQMNGRALKEGESLVRDKEIFRKRHVNDLQAVWARKLDSLPLIAVGACRGGRDDNGRYSDEVRTFLVSEERYSPVPFPYLICDQDIELSEKDLKALEEQLRREQADDTAALLVKAADMTDEGQVVLRCACGASPDTKVIVSREAWENRGDIRQNFVVEGDGVLSLQEYQSSSAAPRL